jgi:phytoene/squalene synthetase
VARAADYYDRSAALADRVHPDGRPCLWAMTSIYQGIFEKIQRRPASVLEQSRVRLASWRKGLIALRASLGRGSPGASGRVARREPEE